MLILAGLYIISRDISGEFQFADGRVIKIIGTNLMMAKSLTALIQVYVSKRGSGDKMTKT